MSKRPTDNTNDREGFTSDTEHTKKNNIIKCYILVISRLHNNGNITTEKQQYNNKIEALIDIKRLIMDLIEIEIYALKLYKKEERERTGLYPDFNDIFIYNLEFRRLTLKKETPNLINFLNSDILGYSLNYKIWEVLTNSTGKFQTYKPLENERLTYNQIEDVEGGHPLYRH